MEWKDVDWNTLRALRDRFLNPAPGDYWHSEQLEHYDLAFAPRIASKWRAVWNEVIDRLPPSMAVWDWACGTGVASQTLVECAPERVRAVWLSDRSAPARRFAQARLQSMGVEANELAQGSPPAPYWFLASHVWNELDDAGRVAFLAALSGAEGFIWVEPGTSEMGRAVIELREKVRGDFHLLAPCPHQGPCGLLAPDRASDWCHHFAPPDAGVFTSSEWKRFSDEMGIDLRALPVSYLVGTKAAVKPVEGGRVLGRPRVLRGHAKALVCRELAVSEETVRGEAFRAGDFKRTRFARWWN